MVKEKNNNFVYVVVGNKIDLNNLIEVNSDDIKNDEDFKDIKYIEVSAKENINVEKPFEELAKLILKKLSDEGSISYHEQRSQSNSFSLNRSNHSRKSKLSDCCK